ncbi:hypothetical protein [Xanthomonas sp. MUS 060]|uniref:hypothetical protein n=1 Tax=Xanthomonas sp. MUS 060 TaxID=1588031 RepID=UPI000B2C811C|nr:hypothetical protein [Xanthomonas sp. MUS 060]
MSFYPHDLHRGDVPIAMAAVVALLFSLLLVPICSAVELAVASCAVDRPALLALDQQQFDQDVSNGGGGWRALAARPGCELAAADLIRDYRKAHPHSADVGLLSWHEGQLRAFAGDSAAAIALMQAAKKPPSQDITGWNPYVDATVAFLEHDRAGFAKAKRALKAVRPSADLPPLQHGMLRMPLPGGQTFEMRWPMNIDVVEGLARCMRRPYRVAYGPDCRPHS